MVIPHLEPLQHFKTHPDLLLQILLVYQQVRLEIVGSFDPLAEILDDCDVSGLKSVQPVQ